MTDRQTGNMNAMINRLSLGVTLLALLSGCGGSEDASIPATSTHSAPVRKAALDSSSLLVDNNAAPISSVGIRGDVLATALTQSPGNRQLYTYTADEPPLVQVDQTVKPSTGDNGITQPFSNDWHEYLKRIGRNDSFSSLRVVTGLSSNKLPDGLDKAEADAEVLKIDSAQLLEKNDISNGDYQKGVGYLTLTQQSGPWIIRRNMVMMYGSSPLSWQDYSGTAQVILRSQQGQRETDFNLCMEVGIGEFSRESCTMWRVPQGWKPGQALGYIGQQITERHQKEYRDDDGNVLASVSRPVIWRTW
ncbi:MAG: hypothetical protein Q4B13_04350 [Lautropia sp.]|nr:hypothetical protein [Lautropia sp.]